MDQLKGVFISYRRSDGSGWADHLHARIQRAAPDVPIFMDIDTIRPGEDFVERINKSLSSAVVFLVIIGRSWLQDSRGGTMLDNADDFVRLEVEKALAAQIPVIPILVDGAVMPDRSQLPESLHPLLRRQAIIIHTDDREPGTQKVVSSVKIYLDEQSGYQQQTRPTAKTVEPMQRVSSSKKWWLWVVGILAVLLFFYILKMQQPEPYNPSPNPPPGQPEKSVHIELLESAIVGSHQPDLARAYGAGYVEVIRPCADILRENRPAGWQGIIQVRWSVVEKGAPDAIVPHNAEIVVLSESLESGEAVECIIRAIAAHADDGVGQNYGVEVLCTFRLRVE